MDVYLNRYKCCHCNKEFWQGGPRLRECSYCQSEFALHCYALPTFFGDWGEYTKRILEESVS